jgi:hypothetical protein
MKSILENWLLAQATYSNHKYWVVLAEGSLIHSYSARYTIHAHSVHIRIYYIPRCEKLSTLLHACFYDYEALANQLYKVKKCT